MVAFFLPQLRLGSRGSILNGLSQLGSTVEKHVVCKCSQNFLQPPALKAMPIRIYDVAITYLIGSE